METLQLLDQLRDLDVRIRVEDGRLRVSAPPGRLTDALKQELVRHKPALLAMLSGDAATAAPPEASSETSATDAPVSFAQRRLWLLHKLDPESAAYHVPTLLDLEGPLDVGALRRSVAWVVRRQRALRTRFVTTADGPRQQVVAAASVPVDVVDLSRLPAWRRRAVAEAYLDDESSRPFDLATAPLLRVRLVRFGPERHRLLLLMPHIVSDGWSMRVLSDELTYAYAAFAQGATPSLPPLSFHYTDYAVWQNEQLSGARLDLERSYWRTRLDGMEPLALPTDTTRPPQWTGRGDSYETDVPPSVMDAVRRFAREKRTTPFVVLLAAFKALLARYTGQHDVVVGTPVAGRTREELEGLVGCFINMLVLRTAFHAADDFRHLVDRVRDTVMEAQEHQHLPFENVVEMLQPERDPSRHPIFQVVFTHAQSWTEGKDEEGGEDAPLTMEPVDVDTGTTKFDLSFDVTEMGGRTQVEVTYSRDLFGAATIHALADRFIHLLEDLIDAPERPVRDARVHDSVDARRMIDQGRSRVVASRDDRRLHERIADQARRTPDAVAVHGVRTQLSFVALHSAAARRAQLLRRHGVGPDDVVAVCMDRCVDTIISLVAILQAGGAYLPVDPATPPERLRAVLDDAGARLVLTKRAVVASAYAETQGDAMPDGVSVLCVDDASVRDAEAGFDPTPPDAVPVDPAQTAYVLFTSGTTGRPKGVMVPHAAIENHMEWMEDRFPLAAWDDNASKCRSVVLQKTPLVFDACMWELFAPLLTGSRLVLAAPGTHRDAPALVDAVRRHGVTTLQLVPTQLRMLLMDRGLPRCTSLERVYCGGEALPPDSVQALRRALPVEVVNLYGPTEVTIDATYAIAGGSADAEEEASTPIGRPITNVDAYVLDAAMRPVPTGIPGELYLGGVGVSRGYASQPALTADRFVPDPFSEAPGARLYRTGDRVRWRNEGDLQFLGRADRQVKVRGHRIEPAEIEAAIQAHADVEHSAVVVHTDASGTGHLVGYVVPVDAPNETSDAHSDAHADPALTDALRATLAERLPTYMIPSTFVVLNAMPLTASGKTDARALPAPGELGTSQPYVPPQGDTEAALCAIWEDVLDGDDVGRHDNFFDRGGHSLLAMQVVVRVAEMLAVRLPVHEVFEAPTVAELAVVVDRLVESGAAPVEAPLVRADVDDARERVAPLSFAQQRLWLLHQLDPASAAYHMPVALRVHGPLDAAALAASFQTAIDRHDVLRTRFEMQDGDPVQHVAPSASMQMRRRDVAHLAHDEQEAVVREAMEAEATEPFDLGRAPLMRARLIRQASDRHVLLLTMHHIVSDGWSMQILTDELMAAYDAHANDRDPALPDVPVQYTDFATWQRNHFDDDGASDLAYWVDRLHDVPHVDLPTDAPRPSRWTGRGGAHQRHVDASTAAAVRRLARASNTTPFLVLLAAFNVALRNYTGQSDLVVGTAVAGRTKTSLERLIGCFVNMLALRTDVTDAATFADVLDRVKDTMRGAQAHQQAPFDQVVEAVAPERDASRHPLFQVVFTQNAAHSSDSTAPTEPSPVWLEPLDGDTTTTKFDLTLGVADGEDGIDVEMTYSLDLFTPDTAARMLEHYVGLVARLVDAPDADLQRLAQPDAERERLESWNDTKVAHASTPAPEIVAQQVRATPDAVAVAGPSGHLTYDALRTRALRLANVLVDAGAGPDAAVGVCLSASAASVVAVLAAAWAGAPYVPIDPAYPADRIADTCADAGVRWLVTTPDAVAHVPEDVLADVATVDIRRFVGASDLDGGEEEAVPVRVGTSHSAYLIYTSGSTGRPKGVVVDHASLAHLVHWHRRAFDVEAADRTTLVASTAFDASVWELWPSLCAGATLCIPSDADRASTARLRDALVRDAVTVSFVPTPLAEHLLRDAWPQRVALRWLLTGGDRLRVRPDDSFPARLSNNYGPTEGTVVTTSGVVSTAPSDQTALPSIGRAIDNVRVHVLDASMQPVPIGAAGELFVGGANVARGYHARPALTAERFVPDPFSDEPGARLYRTGDRVRWRGNGTLDFLGRLDRQVKLRGYRIELGEIEAQIARHPGVESVAVVLHGDAVQRLVAYVVAEGDGVSDSGLRRHLEARLPAYMVPADFVALDAIPLTPNGKIDRAALPAPHAADVPNAAVADVKVAPRDDVEMQLLNVWQSLLDVHPIGVTDDFFHLGGHSLLAMQVVNAIQRRFSVDVSLETLFRARTIRELAAIVHQGSTGAASETSLLVPIQTEVREGDPSPVFLAPPVGGSALCYAQLAWHLGRDRPVYGLRLPSDASGGSGDGAPPNSAATIPEQAARFVDAIRAVQPRGPYHLAGWSAGGRVAYEVARQLRDATPSDANTVRADVRVVLLDSFANLNLPDHVADDPSSAEAHTLCAFAVNSRLATLDEAEAFMPRLCENPTVQHLTALLSASESGGDGAPDAERETAVRDVVASFPAYRSNLHAHYAYRPTAYDGPVLLVAARNAPDAPSRDWETRVSSLDVVSVDASHFDLLDAPHAAEVAEHMRTWLDDSASHTVPQSVPASSASADAARPA